MEKSPDSTGPRLRIALKVGPSDGHLDCCPGWKLSNICAVFGSHRFPAGGTDSQTEMPRAERDRSAWFGESVSNPPSDCANHMPRLRRDTLHAGSSMKLSE